MLPKLEHPIYTVVVPSSKKSIKVRPMLVKEEKILLMAKESDDNNSIMLAVKQIVNNCLVAADTDVETMTLFDLDYLFLKIRANSIDSKIKVSYKDDEDEPVKKGKKEPQQPSYDFEIDLNDVTVKFPDEAIKNVIPIGIDSGIKLKYPEVKVYDSEAIAKSTDQEKIVEELIMNSFESYFEGSKIFKFADSSRTEIADFIDQLDLPTYNKVVEFFNNLPSIFYEVKFTNTKGKERIVTLNKLSDFFTF